MTTVAKGIDAPILLMFPQDLLRNGFLHSTKHGMLGKKLNINLLREEKYFLNLKIFQKGRAVFFTILLFIVKKIALKIIFTIFRTWRYCNTWNFCCSSLSF